MKRKDRPGHGDRRGRRRASLDGARACVLVSGGVDSCVLLRESLRRYGTVQPLYVRAGLRWEGIERAALRRFLRGLRHPGLKPLASIQVPMSDLYGRHWSRTGRGAPGYDDGDASVYIPGRNISLFAKAATYCALEGIPILVSGILSANPFPDGSPDFLRLIQEALSRGLGRRIRIRTPFRSLTKQKVVRRGRDLPLHLTFSCISPRRARHCGDCCKCKERVDAFLAAGVKDATAYAGGPGAVAAGSAPGSRPPAGRLRSKTTRQAPNSATSVR